MHSGIFSGVANLRTFVSTSAQPIRDLMDELEALLSIRQGMVRHSMGRNYMNHINPSTPAVLVFHDDDDDDDVELLDLVQQNLPSLFDRSMPMHNGWESESVDNYYCETADEMTLADERVGAYYYSH